MINICADTLLTQQATYLLDKVLAKQRIDQVSDKRKFKMTQGEIQQIITRYSKGETISSIARGMKWAKSTVGIVVQRYKESVIVKKA